MTSVVFVLSTVSFYKDLVKDFRDKEKSKLDIFLISSYFSVARSSLGYSFVKIKIPVTALVLVTVRLGKTSGGLIWFVKVIVLLPKKGAGKIFIECLI